MTETNVISLPIAPSVIANIESEYVILAKVLMQNSSIDAVSELIKPEDFCEPFYGRIFALIISEHERGLPVNAMTLRPMLEIDPQYQEAGGIAFLAKIGSSAALMFDAVGLALQVRDFAVRRRLIESLRQAISIGEQIDEPIARVIDMADAAVVASTDKGDAIRQPTGEQAMRSLAKSFGEVRRSVRCRVIPSMDQLLGGMRSKQLVIGAGRPGMGKTAVALSFALGAARNGSGVIFITLEMSADELAARAASDLSFNGSTGVAFADINSDKPSNAAMNAVLDAEQILSETSFHIIDAGSLTIGRLEMIVRRYKKRLIARGHNLDLVVVDYLQLLRVDEKGRSNYEVVSEISRRLKGIAKDYDTAVFALAQLSRDVEKRADKRPILSDLRDSGQIEQDADAVLFLYRHEYYLKQSEPKPGDPSLGDWRVAMDDCAGMIDFILAKRRNGVTGNATGYFHGVYQAVRG